jgi:HSP20 family protein
MRALTPWTGMTLFKDEMERMFDHLFEPRWGALEAVGEWTPKLDFSETKDAYVVKLEVPGVEQKEISVALEDQFLTVRGEKSREKEEKDEKFHRVERAWGAFARTIRLPGSVDTEKTTAAFKDGLLTVTLPKTAAAKGSFIPVKAG